MDESIDTVVDWITELDVVNHYNDCDIWVLNWIKPLMEQWIYPEINCTLGVIFMIEASWIIPFVQQQLQQLVGRLNKRYSVSYKEESFIIYTKPAGYLHQSMVCDAD